MPRLTRSPEAQAHISERDPYGLVMDAMTWAGNHEARALLLTIMNEVDQPMGVDQLGHYLGAVAAASQSEWTPAARAGARHVEDMYAGGLVDLNSKGKAVVSERGARYGIPAAGFALGWSARHEPSLLALGRSRTTGTVRAPRVRLETLAHLLDHPNGELGVTINELRTMSGEGASRGAKRRGQPVTRAALLALEENGLVDLFQDEIRYTILNPHIRRDSSTVDRPVVQAFDSFLVHTFEAGEMSVTYKQCLEKVSEAAGVQALLRSGQLTERELGRSVQLLLRSKNIRRSLPGHRQPELRATLAPQHEPAVRELVGIVDVLSREDPEATRIGTEIGRRVLGSGVAVGRLLDKVAQRSNYTRKRIVEEPDLAAT